MLFNNPVPQDARRRIQLLRRSPWSVLKRTVLRWFQAVGLLQVFGELRSCFYRIANPERIIGVRFEELRERAQRLHRGGYLVRTQRYPYMQGIETLLSQRPWLTWQDIELFLQGWFHAEGWMLHNAGTGCDIHVEQTAQKSSFCEALALSSFHEEAAGQSRICPIHPSDASHHGSLESRSAEAHGGREKGEAV